MLTFAVTFSVLTLAEPSDDREGGKARVFLALHSIPPRKSQTQNEGLRHKSGDFVAKKTAMSKIFTWYDMGRKRWALHQICAKMVIPVHLNPCIFRRDLKTYFFFVVVDCRGNF